MDYWVLIVKSADGGVIDAYPEGAPADYMFGEGIPLASKFPDDAYVQFSDNFPTLRKVKDFQPNVLQALIISPRARAIIQDLGVAAEFLPVSIKDHKGKVVAKDHAIVNLLGSVPAIDMKKSEYRLSALDKSQISRIKRLVLDPGKLGKDAKMFRCTHNLTLVLIRDDVRLAFEQAGLTGFVTLPAQDWDGLPL
jgi:hypothetical protein